MAIYLHSFMFGVINVVDYLLCLYNFIRSLCYNRRKVRVGDIWRFGFLPAIRFSVSLFRGYYWPWMLHTTIFLGYACNRLGMYFNLLVWIGALESCGTRECLVFS